MVSIHLRRHTYSLAALAALAPALASSFAVTINYEVQPIVEQQYVVSGETPTVGDTSALVIYTGWQGESHLTYEWSLPALAPGSTITAANVRGRITTTATVVDGTLDLGVYGYAGNGVYTTADNATAYVNQIGTSGNITSPGYRSIPISSSYVQSLGLNGHPFLGTTLVNLGYDTFVGMKPKGLETGIPRLILSINAADTGTIHAKPIFDVTAFSSDGTSFVLSDGDTSVVTQKYAAGNIDYRGLLEFNTAGVPNGSTITDASLTLNVSLFSTSGDEQPQILIYAYSGNMAATLSDATKTANLVGTSQIISATGLVDIQLDMAKIQALNNAYDSIGFTIVGSDNGTQLGYFTSEWGIADAPTLNISYAAVPESATLALAVPALLCMARRRR